MLDWLFLLSFIILASLSLKQILKKMIQAEDINFQLPSSFSTHATYQPFSISIPIKIKLPLFYYEMLNDCKLVIQAK